MEVAARTALLRIGIESVHAQALATIFLVNCAAQGSRILTRA